VPTPDQLSKLVRAADAIDPVIAAPRHWLRSRCPKSELVALKWSDIDLVIGRVRISLPPYKGISKLHFAIALHHAPIRGIMKHATTFGPPTAPGGRPGAMGASHRRQIENEGSGRLRWNV